MLPLCWSFPPVELYGQLLGHTCGARTPCCFRSLGRPNETPRKCDVPVSIGLLKKGRDFRAGCEQQRPLRRGPSLGFPNMISKGEMWSACVFLAHLRSSGFKACLWWLRFQVAHHKRQVQVGGPAIFQSRKCSTRTVGVKGQVRGGRRKRMAERQLVPDLILQMILQNKRKGFTGLGWCDLGF